MSTNLRVHFLTETAARTFVAPILSLFILVLLIIGCTAEQAQLTPPPDFQLVAEVDLSAQPYDEEMLGEFTLAETAVTTIFYTIPNIDTTNFDLSLNGPNGDSMVILHSEDFRTDENGGGTWEQSLTPGVYRLTLSASQTPGTLTVYWNQE